MTGTAGGDGEHYSRLVRELCGLLFTIVSPSETVAAPGRPRSSPPTVHAGMSPAAVASMLLGASMALMLCGSVTFAIGLLLMPWVAGLALLFGFAGAVSTLSAGVFGKAALPCKAERTDLLPHKARSRNESTIHGHHWYAVRRYGRTIRLELKLKAVVDCSLQEATRSIGKGYMNGGGGGMAPRPNTDWGPIIVAVILFVVLSPGLLFQLPARTRVVEFGNMATSAIAILVHAIIFFCLLTIFVVAIGVHILDDVLSSSTLPVRCSVLSKGSAISKCQVMLLKLV
ncbi:hypothetical protein EJB05_17896, partial [Eragrostis curvula]